MKEQTKKEQLLSWMSGKKVFSSVDVRVWGVENYHARADRDARDLAEKGIIKRLTNQEAKERGLVKKNRAVIGWYEA